MIADVVSIERAESTKAVRIARSWSLPCLPLGEDTSQPLLRSLEVLVVFVVKPNQEAKDQGNWRLERAVIRKGGGGGDDEVEEEAERSEPDGDAGDNLVDEVEVVGKSIAEEEKGKSEASGAEIP